jgi:Uma2 family endonuclease
MNWQEVCESPYLQDIPFKIELNCWGQIIMSPAKNIHSAMQWRIQRTLYELLGNTGEIIPECSIQTGDNVKVADVVWISNQRFQQVRHEIAYSLAPEICIEVISAGNTKKEMRKKIALYLKAGANEVWICTEDGKMSFYNHGGKLKCSLLIQGFPERVEI